ncbi:hypothetical protein K378_05643 [Streptomyces sp. Amel2xB2]|uniref:hypothetical protein n=1 Tax=Streptomyces sp. Amel2xB2 TaxID=1305829 RepID=UPI000DB95DAD|nr:hypothetical protein [Streptomyces sp. Amel2xB2]RAJ56642.1 hypothetical protein K378_05643 [Streptomyces sp. Amel2xB2]
MRRQGRAVRVAVVVFSGVVCAAGLWWTVLALERGKLDDADTAGVLSFWLGLVGAVCGAWGLWAAVHGLRVQRTADVVADELAQRVVWAEGEQYRQLLGSGPSAPREPIDLTLTASVPGGAEDGPEDVRPGRLNEVAEIYRSLRPGRMVITGTPSPAGASRADEPDGDADERVGSDAGTGKTVLALALLLGLARERTADEPVPVRLSAASWPGSTVRTWLHTHLTGAYQLNSHDADLLLDAGLVLPVVDGLDEMDAEGAPGYASRAADLLRAVDHFERGGTRCPVVITCRRGHYRALVDADVRPHPVVDLALARIDGAGARDYLARSVATTDVGRERWQPVLAALEEAAVTGTSAAASESAAALAAALDTPWRLTLAATVYQERTPDGTYVRDPADLLALAEEDRLHDHLLDCYIGAAVAASRHGSDVSTPASPGRIERTPRLDADLAWPRLAFLARYLEANSGTASRPPRTVAGRTLSGTDLVLHELWPLGGARRVRWTEGALSVLLVFACLAPLELLDPGYAVLALGLLPFAVLGVRDRAWPQPRRVDLRRLPGHAGLRILVGGLGVVLLGGLGTGLGRGLGYVLVLGSVFTVLLSEGATAPRKQEPVTNPRALLRGDLTARLVGGLGTGAVFGLGVGALSGPRTALVAAVGVAVVFWILLGLTDGTVNGDASTGGHAVVRYLALLLCTRGRLPLRLGRFLDDCYRLGILRVAGTAWQFRHRELQDHLAARPTPPSRR